MCCGYGQGSPRAAGALARARDQKRTFEGGWLRDLVNVVCMPASAALVVGVEGSRGSRLLIGLHEGGRHHLFERESKKRVGSRRAEGRALERLKEHRGACGAPGVGGACGDHPEERDALIHTGGMPRQSSARCAPLWQMSNKSHREEGLRHARSPDNRCGASLRHRGVLFSRDSLSQDRFYFT